MLEVFQVAKLTKAQARKRLKEARDKVFLVMVSGHITMDQANKIIKPLSILMNSGKLK
jgi:hypothetical protein